eukprot:m.7020 g.7020  ORF g.7020 m.7020 type:complete len:62 (-) comp3630_c0_seq1:180-365(-)
MITRMSRLFERCKSEIYVLSLGDGKPSSMILVDDHVLLGQNKHERKNRSSSYFFISCFFTL